MDRVDRSGAAHNVTTSQLWFTGWYDRSPSVPKPSMYVRTHHVLCHLSRLCATVPTAVASAARQAPERDLPVVSERELGLLCTPKGDIEHTTDIIILKNVSTSQ